MRCASSSHGRALAVVAALALAGPLSAQVLIDFVPVSLAATEHSTAPAAPDRSLAGAMRSAVRGRLARQWAFLDGGSAAAVPSDRMAAELQTLALTEPAPPLSIVLDTFDSATTAGSIRPSTTWTGQVTQNTTSITVGGAAQNDNGWGASSLNLDLTGMASVSITAQRNTGNLTPALFLQFEDRAASTNTHVVSIDASLFSFTEPTTVLVPLGTFSSEFLVSGVGSWSIGGGGLGTEDFRMTLYHLELSAISVPEPATAVLLGLALTGITAYQRRKNRSR